MKKKLKTSKTLFKRFKITKKGKLIRNKQFARHLRANKNKRRIRRFKEPVVLSKKQSNKLKRFINR
jgi:ribosomal protein L35